MNVDGGRIGPHPPLGRPGRPGPVQRPLGAMTQLCAAVIVHDRDRGRVLLLRRGPNSRLAPGQWDLPSGKRTLGEPIVVTAVRELQEETAVVVLPDDLRPVHLIHGAHGVDAPNGFLTVVFATGTWSGEPANVEPAKHECVHWMDTERIPRSMVRATAQALRCYLRGGPRVTLYGWHDLEGTSVS